MAANNSSVELTGTCSTLDPEISVVIACYNQTRELGLTLRSFARQDIAFERYELIVVDDHSKDRSARNVVNEILNEFPDLNLVYVRQFRDDGGSYGASAVIKNIGLRLARGKIVFFNNAEIVQVGNTLTHILNKMMQANPGALCLRGVVIEAPYDDLIGKTPASLEVQHDQADRSRERVATADHAGLAAVSRKDLLAVGGIDERFDYWGKEDLDLAARLKRIGVRYIYDKDLKSFHVSHLPNFARESDYQRMCALLEANNKAGLIEANVGRLWGQLNRAAANELSGTVVIYLNSTLLDLRLHLKHFIYGQTMEVVDVLVTCSEHKRAETEQYVSARFRNIPVLSLSDYSLRSLRERIRPYLRTGIVGFIPSSSAPTRISWSACELITANSVDIRPVGVGEQQRPCKGWIMPTQLMCSLLDGDA